MNTQKRIATLVLASMVLSTANTFSIDSAQFGSITKFVYGFEFQATKVLSTFKEELVTIPGNLKTIYQNLFTDTAETAGKICGGVTGFLTAEVIFLAGVYVVAASYIVAREGYKRATKQKTRKNIYYAS